MKRQTTLKRVIMFCRGGKTLVYMWAKDLDSPNLGELRFVPETAALCLTTVLFLAQYHRVQTYSLKSS